MVKEKLTLCIDFDGTCTTHEYPFIGKEIGAVPVLKKLVDNGHKLILFTMRGGKQLEESVKWFEDNKISLYGIQTNPTQKNWTASPKAYGEHYIDDAAIGCPLVVNNELSDRPFVDWVKVEEILIEKGLINEKEQ